MDKPSGAGRTCVFDVEGDNLLPKLTKLHCIVAIDVDTEEVFSWRPWELEDGLRFLAECECLIGHNIIDYDLRAIEKLHPWWKRPKKIADTLIYCKIIWPPDTLWGRDLKLRDRGILPAFLLKSHSLKAWGLRIGEHKAEYTGGFEVWNEEMHAYMIQDGVTNLKLWRVIRRAIGWDDPKPGEYVWPELPFEIEQGCAAIIAEQETTGFHFNRAGAVRLSQELRNEQADLENKLVEHFGSWWAPLDDPQVGHTPTKDRKVKLTGFPDITVPRFGKNGNPLKPYVGPPFEHYTAGAPYVRIQRVTFSPSSRDHLGQRLQEVYGWRPTKFGKDGKPTVDETTIKSIPDDVIPADIKETLLNYFVVTKTIGMVSGGNKAWLKCLKDDGKIHHRMNTCGAITGRGIHFDPNLGQVPGVQKDKQGTILKGIKGGFGYECRSLFEFKPEGTGTDASSLELLCLGHYLAPYDEGAFSDRVSDPNRDPHTEHSQITGLNRHDTKTVTYLSIYGGGAGRAAEELELEDDEVEDLLAYSALPALLKHKARMDGDDYREPSRKEKALLAKGHKVIKAFESGIPGWKELKDAVTKAGGGRRWLKGLDGRKLYVRKAHASLNTLLQGAGAIICKLWMIILREKLIAQGLKPGVDFRQVAWVHDELQVEHRAGLGKIIGKASDEAMKEVGKRLGFRGVLRTDFKTGATWAETH